MTRDQVFGPAVTELLQQALEAVKWLEPEKQDAIAAIILAEIADDARWDPAFAKSQDQLAKLADEARDDIAAGRTRRLPPGEGIRRSAGVWSDDPEGVDEFLRVVYELRGHHRPPLED